MNIRYLPYKEIDKAKWDNCISNAANSLIYARSFYLDAMANNWDALVLDDYEAVMPLPWKKKWNIKYLYQPPFTQQLGVFSIKPLTASQVKFFIETASQHFKFAEITLNYSNVSEPLGPVFNVTHRDNYTLNLNRPYEAMHDNYLPAFTKSLRRIRKFEMLYVSSVNYQKTVELYRHLYGNRFQFIDAKIYQHFEDICKLLFRENGLVIRHARSTGNKLLASAILLKDENRLYNIISCITSEGKKLEANYFLYDSIIKEFASTPLLLDFEGSDIEGVAAFYKKFNPEHEPYPFIKFNTLPAFIKWFKK